ncbi:hypothetical protein FH588_02005 (plasmid) [Leptospira interrogans]|uniref:hypothetical protein n=1 Tax=Leptospira interrogans TaxID=173 RepID=UPI00034560EE|nr:hypothetical protein [Leptospira interrogans]UNE65294.1 hypothetical protein FH588_02005 [Leptospira interrogans]
MDQEHFIHHPEVLHLRAILVEGLYFQKLTHALFDDILMNVDKRFKDRDRLIEFITKENLLGDYEKFLQQKEYE